MLKKEMADPGKTITDQRYKPQQLPGRADDGDQQQYQYQRRCGEMQSTTNGIAMFIQIKRIELLECTITRRIGIIFHYCSTLFYSCLIRSRLLSSPRT